MSAKTSLEERLMRSESEIVQKTFEANKMSNDLALIKDEKLSADRKIVLVENYKKKLEDDLKTIKQEQKKSDQDRDMKD